MPSYDSMLGCAVPTDECARQECFEQGVKYLGRDPHTAALKEMHRIKGIEEFDPMNKAWSNDKMREAVVKIEKDIVEAVRSSSKLAEEEAKERDKIAEKLGKKLIQEQMKAKGVNLAKARGLV